MTDSEKKTKKTTTRENEYAVMKKVASTGATKVGLIATWDEVRVVKNRAEGHKWVKENFDDGYTYRVDIRGDELNPKVVPTRVVKF